MTRRITGRIIFIAATSIIISLLAFRNQVADTIIPDNKMDKNITLAVYKGSDYSSKVYESTSATVHVVIKKVRRGKETVVFEKTLDSLQLKQYPDISNAIAQNITIPNVADNKEHLVITYTLTYNSKGTELQMQDGMEVTKGTANGKVYINI